ncbi:DNA polymerase [Mycobacterium phage Fowlmouth]|uniref:DnaE-like DNA polymerase III (Alpha) n=1 Tax=Mycobacterium phage Fowlmouth TaxID=2419978 RepID=A0A3G2KGE5_9CAUD|nr:DNA polymerase [Mycobacterium phage Fowlmouth]AYN58035.1 DnaE-like DNA polymerase III alpha [Mycobacterium phage Fowlmouth]
MTGVTLEELYRIPLDDEPVFDAFRKGDVLGIFQFEGNTTRRILKAVQPTTFMHLADVNALSRPGADDKAYIQNKNSGEELEYPHEIMREHLSWTYGVVVYEEQILMILRDLGGFAPEELNRMRKIIHDKLGSTAFNENFKRFVKGATGHGLSEDAAESIWNGLVSASGYAFNIAHSVSYAHIGYWQMWLKIHYPAEFFTGQLLKCSDDVRRGKLIQEAERHGIKVSPPKILVSKQNWSLVRDGGQDEIVAGFEAIPGIGPKTSVNIINWVNESIGAGHADELDWTDLKQVKGIGPKTIKTIVDFCEKDDPFEVHEVQRVLDMYRQSFKLGEIQGVPLPTHISLDIPPEREMVCYMGIARGKKYYDAVEQLQKRTSGDLSYEEALEQLDDPHLVKYVAIDVEDEYGETVRVRVSRWKYPQFQNLINSIKVNRDVVVVRGFSSDFGGISIQAKDLAVLNPKADQS